MNKNITTQYNSSFGDLKDQYQHFIRDSGPYKYFITITFTKNYQEVELHKRINFLLKILNRRIFNSRKNTIFLRGFCFIESSGVGSICKKHIHILINDHDKLDAGKSFESKFFDSVDKVKSEVNGTFTQYPEFNRNCVCIEPVYNESGIVDYCTDEFWKDKNGDFVKLIGSAGLII